MLRSIRAGLVTMSSVVLVAALPHAANATTVDHVHWRMNEISGNLSIDSSGVGNHGNSYNVRYDGEAYAFNGTNSRVIVPDTAPTGPGALDPGSQDFSWGVTVSMPAPPARGETFDLMRKGLSGSTGGNYKLEVKNARGRAVGRCVVRDAAGVGLGVLSMTNYNLAGTGVHTISCTKTSSRLTIRVDGTPQRSKTVSRLGSVSNTFPVGLGAKAGTTAKTGFDWFKGKIFHAWISVH